MFLGEKCMIIDEIKKANIQAIKDKNKNARTIYSIIMNKHLLASVDARTSGNSVTDADMVRIISKTIKELDEEQENYLKAGNDEQVKNIAEQKSILEVYLPKMLTGEEIKAIILGLQDKSTPAVMKHFKQNYNGAVDMKLVSEVLKSLT